MSKHLAEQLARTTAVAALTPLRRDVLIAFASRARVSRAVQNGTSPRKNDGLPVGSMPPFLLALELKKDERSVRRAITDLCRAGYMRHVEGDSYAVGTTTDRGATSPAPQHVSPLTNSASRGQTADPPRHLMSPPRVSTPTTNVVVAPAAGDGANQPVLNGTVAQQLVADYVDACTDLGVVTGPRIKGRVGKEAVRLLHDGHAYAHLRLAVRELARRNAPPATLEYIVGDVERVANGVPTGRARAAALTENPVDARLRAIREGRA